MTHAAMRLAGSSGKQAMQPRQYSIFFSIKQTFSTEAPGLASLIPSIALSIRTLMTPCLR